MQISELLSGIDGIEKPSSGIEISGIENDSRQAGPDTLFIAASGYTDDAHVYVESAYANGCRAFLVDRSRKAALEGRFPGAWFGGAPDVKSALASVAAKFYGEPSKRMTLIGVTGTKGKTTTTTAIFKALRGMGHGAGMIGTIRYHINDTVLPATNTTPDLLALNRLMADMAAAGAKYLVMEVSSHALELQRVEGLHFDIGGFTNFTQDHLDFHKTMDEYFAAKLKIFDLLAASSKLSKTLIANRDMNRFGELEQYAKRFPPVALKTASVKYDGADYRSRIVSALPSGSRFELNGRPVEVSIPGEFNVYNFTMAAAILKELGFDYDKFVPLLKGVKVPGRIEPVDMGGKCHVLVDYAHTPDAMENLLRTVRSMLPEGGRVITVFGAGGDRDRTKRPLMGEAAVKASEIVVVTSDNPRTEDPGRIIEDVLEGVERANGGREVIVEADRRKAIRLAVAMAKPDDVVVIAGKGHEDYQIVGKTKTHFSDQEEARNWAINKD